MVAVIDATAQPGLARAAPGVLAAAFATDPIYRRILPDDRQRARALAVLFRLAAADARRHGTVDVAVDHAQVLGAAVWLRPGAFPLGLGRKLRAVPGLAALWRAAPNAFLALTRLGRAVDAAQPPGPAWYLQAVGVHPDEQGRGVGGALLSHGLDRVDRDRAVARLETAVPAAARLYARFGFQHIQTARLLDEGPAHILMQRPPAPAADLTRSVDRTVTRQPPLPREPRA